MTAPDPQVKYPQKKLASPKNIPYHAPAFGRNFGGVFGFDEGAETQGACRGADYLVNPPAKNIVAENDNYALAA